MVKEPLLVSQQLDSAIEQIRTRQLEEGVLGTVQLYDPSFDVDPTMVVQLAPPLVEYSIFTEPPAFWLVQVML